MLVKAETWPQCAQCLGACAETQQDNPDGTLLTLVSGEVARQNGAGLSAMRQSWQGNFDQISPLRYAFLKVAIRDLSKFQYPKNQSGMQSSQFVLPSRN